MMRILSLILLALPATPQAAKTSLPPPDVANASYGPHERNVLDLWKAKSEGPTPLVVYIHGGGFRAGDKSSVSPILLELCRKAGISVAAINYRLSHQAPYPAPMLDGARAIQFLRSKAAEWNLNPKAVAATGGSAGAGISLWVGFHEDLAEAGSSDLVKRQSTRLSAMGVFAAQSSYDPRFIAKEIGEAAARHPALGPFYGLDASELDSPKAHRLYEDASPLTHLSVGDPAVFLFYNEANAPLPADAKPGQGIHHPRFGLLLKERMNRLGIECEYHHKDDYRGDMQRQVHEQMVAFFQRHFGGAGSDRRFVGSWKLISFERRSPGGEIAYPLGRDAVGRITYHEDGRMSVQIMRPDRPRSSGADSRSASSQEAEAAYRGYVAYYGSWTVDDGAGVVIHRVEGSLYPNYVGTDQRRFYQFEGDRLTLEAQGSSARSRLVWERVR